MHNGGHEDAKEKRSLKSRARLLHRGAPRSCRVRRSRGSGGQCALDRDGGLGGHGVRELLLARAHRAGDELGQLIELEERIVEGRVLLGHDERLMRLAVLIYVAEVRPVQQAGPRLLLKTSQRLLLDQQCHDSAWSLLHSMRP